MSFEIRKATLKDCLSLVGLLNQLGYSQVQRENLQIVLEEVLCEPKMAVVIAIDKSSSEPIGFLTYSYKTQLRVLGILMEIDELVVDERFRGRGVGGYLLDYSKKVAKEIGVKVIVLSTNRDRPSYQRGFYLKQGFTEKNSALMICRIP